MYYMGRGPPTGRGQFWGLPGPLKSIGSKRDHSVM